MMDVGTMIALGTSATALAGVIVSWKRVGVDATDSTVAGMKTLIGEQRTEIDRLQTLNQSQAKIIDNIPALLNTKLSELDTSWQLRFKEQIQEHKADMELLRRRIAQMQGDRPDTSRTRDGDGKH